MAEAENDQHATVPKKIVSTVLGFCIPFLGALCAISVDFWARLSIAVAMFSVPACIGLLFLSKHPDPLSVRVLRKYAFLYVFFLAICLTYPSYCFLAGEPTAAPRNSLATIVTAPHAKTFPVPASKSSNDAQQMLIADNSDATPPASNRVAALSQPFIESKANDFYVVMQLPSGVEDLKISANGSPVTPIKLNGLRLKVFVPPKKTTHFTLKCSRYGTSEYPYFAEIDGDEIEPLVK